jgi:tetratricopeptide (TPR) repeat protein
MKVLISLVCLFFSVIFYSQTENLKGNWILDDILYTNGNQLEINHPLFSSFTEYNISGNNLKINDNNFKVNISQNQISTNFRKLNYKFENAYLVISEVGDDKIYYFLKSDSFLKKYTEFQPQKNSFEGKEVYIANEIVKPAFLYDQSLDDFLQKNIPSYFEESAKNNYFEAVYIISADNKISDIKITKGISKNFDNQFKTALLKSEKYLRNNFEKDILVTKSYNFFKIFESLTSKDEKKIDNIYEKGRGYFEKNDFENAIKSYSKINEINITQDLKKRFGYSLDQIFMNLGISYLATNEISKSCECFSKVGGITNFKVRNYLRKFCK